MVKSKTEKASAQRKQRQIMKKHQKDNVRHKNKTGAVVSENAVQHQMLGQFGSVSNYIRNVQHLALLFAEDEDLKAYRLDAKALYAKINATRPDMNAALKDLYSNDDFTFYSREYEEFWKKTRAEILPEFITKDLTDRLTKTFKALMQKKRGFKKDYRAVLAGTLLLQSHVVSLKEAPVEENSLWEILFNATLKEGKIELPEPVAVIAPAEAPAEAAAATPPEAPAAETPPPDEGPSAE